MPVGANIPLVIQLGRWRRQITITTTACVDTALTADQTRLPRTKAEGDIPHMALVSGDVDALECVLRKIGIDDSEFTNPSGTGRIHLFQGNGAKISGSTPAATTPGGVGDDARQLRHSAAALLRRPAAEVTQQPVDSEQDRT